MLRPVLIRLCARTFIVQSLAIFVLKVHSLVTIPTILAKDIQAEVIASILQAVFWLNAVSKILLIWPTTFCLNARFFFFNVLQPHRFLLFHSWLLEMCIHIQHSEINVM